MHAGASIVDRDADRLSLLYRFGIPAEACRILEISAGSEPVLRGTNWAASTVTHRQPACSSRPAEFGSAGGPFDAIVVHRAFHPSCLPRLIGLLQPGGTIAGCVESSHSLTRLSGRGGARAPASSPHACRTALLAAGLCEIRLFTVVPDLDSPRKLLSIGEGWSRRVSKQQLEALRPLLSRWGFLAWRLLAEAGIGHHLGYPLFFSGRRTCSPG